MRPTYHAANPEFTVKKRAGAPPSEDGLERFRDAAWRHLAAEHHEEFDAVVDVARVILTVHRAKIEVAGRRANTPGFGDPGTVAVAVAAGVRGGRPTSPLRRNVQVWEHAAVWRRHDFRGRRRHLDSIGAAMAQVDDRSPATIHAVPGIDGVPIEMSTVGFRPILKAGSTTLDLAVRTPKA